MNILIIPSWYINEKNPIKGSFFREQALALSKKGHNVNIAYVSLHPRTEFFSKAHFKTHFYMDHGVGVYTISIPSFGIERNKKIFFGIQILLYKKIIRKILRNRSVDIIHAHSYYPAGFVSLALKKFFSIPLVITEHSSKVAIKQLTNEKKDILNKTVEKADSFICVSDYLRKSVKEITNTSKEIEVVANLLSPLFYYQPREQTNNKFVILSVGSLINLKRHIFLINAFNNAFRFKENVVLEIIGIGPEYAKLETEIKRLNLEGRVKLLGGFSREDTALKMKNSDMFALASSVETFGVVYIEALASGLPVLTVTNGGSEDIITDKDGVVCEVDNVEDITIGLLHIYENISKYNKKEISERIIETYSEKSISERLINIYELTLRNQVK